MPVLEELAKHIKIEGTTTSDGEEGYVHSHMFQVNDKGDGKTISTAPDKGQKKRKHVHHIKNFKVKKADDDKHRHGIEI